MDNFPQGSAEKQQRSQRQIATWLLIGVAMIIIQVLIGGITRLTESGLSITEWKPITGTLPPMNDAAWQSEFDKYKVTDQFKYVHQHFSLAEFKFIFFWEWFHRTWARLLGLVFLFGFVYFLITKKFNKGMIKPIKLTQYGILLPATVTSTMKNKRSKCINATNEKIMPDVIKTG